MKTEFPRVAFVTPGFSSNEEDSCLPILRDAVIHLAERLEVQLFTLRYPFHKGRYQVFGANVTALGGANRSGLWRVPLLLRSLSAIIRQHRASPFGLVHGFFADEPGFLSALAGRLLHVPSVVTVMGGELVALPSIGYGGLLGRVNPVLSRWAIRNADCVTALSESLASSVQKFDNKRLECLPLGVDTSAFSPGPGPAVRPPALLSVGSLVPVKDPFTLLEAFRKVRRTLPDLRLDFIGDGPLRPELARFADESDFSDCVTFHGFVPRSELASWYRRASLVVISSVHESLNMVALEAAACGTPVVGTRVGILPELIPPGYCVPRGDAEALSRVIVRILTNGDERNALREHASARVADKFNLNSTMERLLGLYRELIERRSAC